MDMLLNPGWFKVEYRTSQGVKRSTVFAADQFDAVYVIEQQEQKRFNRVQDVIRVLEIKK